MRYENSSTGVGSRESEVSRGIKLRIKSLSKSVRVLILEIHSILLPKLLLKHVTLSCEGLIALGALVRVRK